VSQSDERARIVETASAVSPQRAQQEVELLDLCARLEGYLNRMYYLESLADDQPGSELEILRTWASLFSSELQTVFQTRNSVVHRLLVSDANLVAASTLCLRLLNLLGGKLSSPNVAEQD